MSNPTEVPRNASVLPLYALAILSGLMYYGSFFPLNIGMLAWCALSPLFLLVYSNARGRHIYLTAFIGGLACFIPALQWMRVAHPAMYATWFLLAIICAVYFPIAIWLMRCLVRRQLPLTVVAPAVWVALEYMRCHFPTGFSWLASTGHQHLIGFGWYFAGYTQHELLPLIQIADTAGAYGVSFLVVMANAVICLWLRRLGGNTFRNGGQMKRPWLGTAGTAAAVAGTLLYGYWRLDHAPFEEGPRVALLQSNLPQSVKMAERETVDKQMASLLWKATMEVPPEAYPDLVVWPETTCGENWFDIAPGTERSQAPVEWLRWVDHSQQFAKAMSYWQCNQLLGLNGLERDAAGTLWKFNSAKLIRPDGSSGPRYDKMHLVPFGEYVPLGNIFPWLQALTPYSHDYSCKPGEHWTRFSLQARGKEFQFACVICYEDSDPSLARNYVRLDKDGPSPVDFLVNISNDGWFNGTEEHEQHFAICRFRAIECRRSIVRAVNMGISGIIDADGQVAALPGPTWSESKKILTVVNGTVPIDHRSSLYPALGDWLPMACWGLIGGTLLVAFLRRRMGNPVGELPASSCKQGSANE